MMIIIIMIVRAFIMRIIMQSMLRIFADTCKNDVDEDNNGDGDGDGDGDEDNDCDCDSDGDGDGDGDADADDLFSCFLWLTKQVRLVWICAQAAVS